MTPPLRTELVVAADVGAAAAERVLALRPRTLALAGGSTPRELYRRLATTPLDWAEMDVFFSDERCLPPTHPESNYAMAREALLRHVPARVHPMPGAACDAAAYEQELRTVFPQTPPAFDLILLGLGADGHTASLFPGDRALDERERWVVRVERPDYARLTFTLPLLSAARAIILLVCGTRKRQALGPLLAGEDGPAARLRAPLTIIADQAAAP